MSKRQAERVSRLRREKRGVVLLVVVSILTLFLMVGVTYVLIAGHYHDSSKQNQLAKRYGDEPEREMEEVLGQVLFGTPQVGANSPRSVISPHSLLADLYGNEIVIGNVANIPTTLNGGQTIYFQATLPAQLIPNYYAGRVITFTNGPAAGVSTRVMAYFPPSGGNPAELQIEAPESDLPIPVSPSINNRFVINGAPFNGTGAGFLAGGTNLDAFVTLNYTGTANNYLSAYLPNYPYYPAGSSDPTIGGMDEPYDTPNWDNMFLAFVPPSKMTATVPPRDGNEQTTPPLPILPSFHRPDLVRFWRDTLFSSLLSGVPAGNRVRAFQFPYGDDAILGTVDDWPPAELSAQQAQEIVALKRMIILRPLLEDHPNFRFVNSNFREDAIPYYEFDADGNGFFDRDNDGDAVYDVDNDGDGIAESIWIDPGLPVVTAPNGRRYKRLVAICIKDLDGRVNPNVHGNQILATIPNARTAAQLTDTFAGMDPNALTPINLPRGLGFGPSEVDFRHIFNNVLPYSSANDDAAVYNNVLDQRYFSLSNQVARPGYSNPMNANDPLNDDGWSRLKTIGMPTDHTNLPRSAYSTPPDVWGRGAMAVDYTGQPLWGFLGTGERLDDPYEAQWNQLRASFDAPYTVSELEALLRYHDQGAATIPSRLMQIAGYGNPAGNYLATESRGTPGASQIRRDAFGMGSYIPAPRLSVPRELRSAFGPAVGNSTILDLYAYRLLPSGNIPAEMQTIVPFEFLKGQIFNLNRELGNGIDDNGDGVVDDPAEIGSETIPTTNGQMPLDYLNDSNLANTANPSGVPDPRQMMARHLYCLAMFLRNTNNPHTIDLDGDGMGSAPETARAYAQWAINVVDFRDPDSIMSPFEYDIDPTNGWDVDGNLLTDGTATYPENLPPPKGVTAERGLVWGCERPELLISETVNFHARRTEDRPNDVFNGNADNGRTDDPGAVIGEKDFKAGMGLNDFDARLSPEGSTFIELYNPWFDRSGGAYDHMAAELYADADSDPMTTGDTGVDLSRVNGSGSPVWRMIVVKGSPANINNDPDYPRPEALMLDANGMPPLIPPPPGSPNVERSIYFADLVTRPVGAIDGEIYFPSGGIPRAPILPGRYGVIGSAGFADGSGNYITAIGRRTTDPAAVPGRPDYATTRRIILTPNANPNTPQTVRVRDNVTDGTDDVNAADIRPMVALPVDMVWRIGAAAAQPHSLNISEQLGGYPGQPGGPPAVPGSPWIAPTATEEGYYGGAAPAGPIDTPLDNGRTDGGDILANDITSTNYRALHLQRLANPLLPWNGVTNPYMTVDTSSMDVMSFNGVTNTADPSAPPPPAVSQNFQAFQRGGRYYDAAPDSITGYTAPVAPNERDFRDLWPRELPGVAPNDNSPTESTGNAHFQTRPLYHTLGFLNRRYQPYFDSTGPALYRGAPAHLDLGGAVASPFPYLAFNNRPFNNVTELLQVPAWQSSNLLGKFDVQKINPLPTVWTSMYQTGAVQIPYGHLPNFFHTSDDPLAANSPYSPEFSRVLDYMETRTPYIDTEKYFNPALFVTGNLAPAGYRPPFNYLSRFREPGRININTIFDSSVWNAAVRGFPGMCTFPVGTNEGDGGLFLTHLVLSRQGYGATGADVLQHDPGYPSLFSNPFRTADSSDLMPPLPATLRKSPADGGLLRRDTNALVPPPAIDDDRPLFGSDNTDPLHDAARNPYFRYQGLQKIGNVFSTNSNCYAVWITMGYFEVEANPPSGAEPGGIGPAHPDGLRLAQEVGVDTGEVKRHRAFYIIDRSIPVGYEPGHRHNTDKAVLLKRYIE